MGFQQAIKLVLNKYFQFGGRAPRSEYWYWVLFLFMAGIILAIVDAVLFGEGQPVSALFSLATLIPGIAVSVRRLHDTGRSGWLFLLIFIPLVGVVLLLIWACLRGDPGVNRFGPDPLHAAERDSLTQG